MKCPVCSYRLRQVKSKNVVVDVCTHCSGVWFDSGELQVFLRELVKRPDIAPKKTNLFEPLEVRRIDRSAAEIRLCPKCELVMKTINYAYDSNVFIDKCPQCEGIWTDGGEVRQLAGHLKEDPRASVIGQDIVRHHEHVKELGEWADLAGAFSGPMAFIWLFMPRIIIPLGDDNEREKFPAITLSIIILCTAVFLYQAFGVHDLQGFVDRYGFVPQNFWSIGLMTSKFLHGGWIHLIGNMYFLWIFGDNVEERLGYWGYLIFYLAGGIAASILHALFYMHSDIPSIGASGAISAVMGAYLFFFPKIKLKLFCIFRVVSIPVYLYLGIWFVFQLLYSILTLSNLAISNVGWFAHIGGFIFGMAVALFFRTVAFNGKLRQAESQISA